MEYREKDRIERELQKFQDRFTYKPGASLSIRVQEGARPYCFMVEIRVTMRVPNVKSDLRELIPVILTRALPIEEVAFLLDDEGGFARVVRDIVIEMEIHEVDEWFQLGGKCLVDPHPQTLPPITA